MKASRGTPESNCNMQNTSVKKSSKVNWKMIDGVISGKSKKKGITQ